MQIQCAKVNRKECFAAARLVHSIASQSLSAVEPGVIKSWKRLVLCHELFRAGEVLSNPPVPAAGQHASSLAYIAAGFAVQNVHRDAVRNLCLQCCTHTHTHTHRHTHTGTGIFLVPCHEHAVHSPQPNTTHKYSPAAVLFDCLHEIIATGKRGRAYAQHEKSRLAAIQSCREPTHPATQKKPQANQALHSTA
jgi:hypothetical protein